MYPEIGETLYQRKTYAPSEYDTQETDQRDDADSPSRDCHQMLPYQPPTRVSLHQRENKDHRSYRN